MANRRIYYATEQVGFKGDGDAGAYTAAHGVQSVGISTTFNLEQVFELGQLSIFENIEGIPDIQVTLNKVLDGYPPLALFATIDATSPDLAGRSSCSCLFAMSVFQDTDQYATGTADNIVECSGLYLSSASYTFGVDGAFTEDVTLVGNDKVWKLDSRVTETKAAARQTALSFDGVFDGDDAPIGSGGVNYRKNLMYDLVTNGCGADVNGAVEEPDATILPTEIVGIDASGVNVSTSDGYKASVQSITVSTDLGRTDINELGRRAPYHRTVNWPVEVTCEITVISKSGDNISATEEGILSTTSTSCSNETNTANQTIRVATCEGLRLYLGKKNRLQSVTHGGADAGGGNATDTYSYTNFNDLTIIHSGDPSTSGSTWWTNRSTYLCP